jgi:hypothetical protein
VLIDRGKFSVTPAAGDEGGGWECAFPGQKKDNPGQKKDNPGQKKDNPGQKKDNPGQKKDNPGQKKDNPGQKKDNPGQKKDNPGQKKDNPGQKKDNPGQKKDNPGQKKDNAGRVDACRPCNVMHFSMGRKSMFLLAQCSNRRQARHHPIRQEASQTGGEASSDAPEQLGLGPIS